jgi:hypothetical protein
MAKKAPSKRKNPAAVALGRKGGLASRKNMTAEEKAAMARKAAEARWSKQKPKE